MDNIYEKYKNVYREYFESIGRNNAYLNRMSSERMSKEEFGLLLKEKAQQNRADFLRNEEAIEQYFRVYTRGEKEMDAETAQAILTCTYEFLLKKDLDGELSFDAMDPLIRFYEATNDQDHLVECYFIKGYAAFFLNPTLNRAQYSVWSKRLDEYADRLDELKSPRACSFALKAIYNEIVIGIFFDRCDATHIFYLIDRFKRLVHDENIIKRCDLSPEYLEAQEESLHYVYLALSRKNGVWENLTPAQKKQIENEMSYSFSQFTLKTEKKICEILLVTNRRYFGLATDQEVIDSMLSVMDFEPEFDLDYADTLELNIDILPSINRITDDPVLLARVRKYVLDFIRRIPYRNDEFKLPSMTLEFVLPFLCSFHDEELLPSLLQVTSLRQLTTFVHSSMVSELSVLIAEAMLEQDSTFFITLPHGLADDREKLLAFIRQAGSYHDMGKSICPNLIEMQSRRVTKYEFSIIQNHVSVICDLLSGHPECEGFVDVAVGHHKFNDGEGGYPASYDNTRSPYKPVVDLISIADSLDAATDNLGRNYYRTRTVDAMVNEFDDLAPHRYNKRITSVMRNNQALREALNHLVCVRRMNIYYDCYLSLLPKNASVKQEK